MIISYQLYFIRISKAWSNGASVVVGRVGQWASSEQRMTQQNINQSETRIGYKKLSVELNDSLQCQILTIQEITITITQLLL